MWETAAVVSVDLFCNGKKPAVATYATECASTLKKGEKRGAQKKRSNSTKVCPEQREVCKCIGYVYIVTGKKNRIVLVD